MFRTNFALAVGLCLALSTASASAGELSYESRGYGGPLYVGPNFQQGGQHSPPVYGPKSSSQERATTKRMRGASKSRMAPATQEATTEKEEAAPAAKATPVDNAAAETENSAIAGGPVSADKAPASSSAKSEPAPRAQAGAESENSTISSLQTGNTDTEVSPQAEAASASPATCKRFIAAAGKTVTVPCD